MFRCARLQLEIELLDDLAPRGYWGSRLRGGFGCGLLHRLCPKTDPRMASQHDTCDCDYVRLFKPTQQNLGLQLVGRPLGGSANLPATFVVDPPAPTGYPRQGSRLSFGLTAIGPMCDYTRDCILAFEEFGKFGLDGRDHQLARFRLVNVWDQFAGGRSIYVDGQAASAVVRSIADVAREVRASWSPEALSVAFQTNVRIQNQRARLKDPRTGLALFSDFFDLVSNLAHRIACLWQAYGNDWPGRSEYQRSLDELLKASRRIEMQESDLEMRDLWGYSNLRDEPKDLRGFVGRMKFAGDFVPFLELLATGEIVHIGGETANGLGKYAVAFPANEAVQPESEKALLADCDR